MQVNIYGLGFEQAAANEDFSLVVAACRQTQYVHKSTDGGRTWVRGPQLINTNEYLVGVCGTPDLSSILVMNAGPPNTLFRRCVSSLLACLR